MQKTVIKTLLLILLLPNLLTAKEGMWIPMLLKQLNESEMQTMGLELSAEDIYSINRSSLKDAIVKFGGGCTGELISAEGLMLTNHHCGYGQIQSHSSLENDFLKDGFWAAKRSDELPNPGLTATFIVRMEDVTREMLRGVDEAGSDRDEIMRSNKDAIIKKAVENTHYEAEVKSFYGGNQYFLIVKEVFKDVRLAGAPPSSIGKFGFDTDNWVWPRHTGDFSLFRIYADKDNKPAEYSKKNVPYRPKHHLPISLKGVQKDDFTMVFGFPARTEMFLPAPAVEYVIDQLNPARIGMRDISLEILDEEMRKDRKVNIQYASKQSRISNAWKKWIGQNNGLKNINAAEKKRAFETEFKAAAEKCGKSDWADIPEHYIAVYGEYVPLNFARAMLIEYYHYGPEVFKFAGKFAPLAEDDISEDKLEEVRDKLRKSIEGHFKNYDRAVDLKLVSAMTPEYLNRLGEEVKPELLYEYFNEGDFTAKLAENTLFTDKDRLTALIENFNPAEDAKKIAEDPAFKIGQNIIASYTGAIKPKYDSLRSVIDSLDTEYIKAVMQLMPNSKHYYPDANFTLRLSYGKAEGYSPKNGVEYTYYTTIDGIMEKMDTSSAEFDVPVKLRELYDSKDYGMYADDDGELRVCFIASNHTSGGNSGSPAINGKGELVGLNFDRTWESTMSDIMYDPEICRNIMVDIRYVLFIADKFAGASHLIEEMTLVKE